MSAVIERFHCIEFCHPNLLSYSSGNEKALQAAVVKQPVMVMVDTSHSSFQLYESGVYYEHDCSSTRLDHHMLVVGYGESSTGEEYWIVGVSNYALLI